MKKLLLVILLLMGLTAAFGQTTTVGNSYDNGPTLPVSCSPTAGAGALFFKTVTNANGPLGQYQCPVANTWRFVASPLTATVAGLPAAANATNVAYVVTDGTSSSDCVTGSGSTKALCISNGSAWVSLGGSAGTTINATNNILPKRSSATAFVDSSITDNGTTVSTTEPISAGATITTSGTTAGGTVCTQGTTNGHATANTITDQCPAAVTAYENVKPGVAATGIMTNNVAAGVNTQGFSGDANHSASGVVIGSGTSIGSTSLCSTTFCPAGTYRINTYIDITTACGTSGTYVVNLIYTDDQGSKTIPININGTGAVASTGVLTTTSTANFGEDTQIIRSTGAASINYSTTATACGTAGPMVGKLYLSVEPVQ